MMKREEAQKQIQKNNEMLSLTLNSQYEKRQKKLNIYTGIFFIAAVISFLFAASLFI